MTVERIMAEADALSAAASYIRGNEDLDVVRHLTRKALQCQDGRTSCDSVIRYAMRRVLGEGTTLPSVRIPTKPLYRHAQCRTIRAWLIWCSQEDVAPAIEDLDQLDRMLTEKRPKKDNLRLFTLRPWVRAVRALLQGQSEEARTFFHRANELGSQYGTEPVIQWVYVASFY